jgi:UDP-N-acetylmuramoyl-tripeptide--D-alanyl-D-alanine ligase
MWRSPQFPAEPAFTVRDILASVPGAELVAPGDPPVEGFGRLACHTDEVVAGASMFAAVRGGGAWYVGGRRGFDYHPYVGKALELGATGVLVEDVSSLPAGGAGSRAAVVRVPGVIEALGLLTAHKVAQRGVAVTAVTGSTGKTSTCEIVACVLRQRHATFKFISNRATPISVPRILLNAGLDAYERVVMEMPMDAQGQITTLCAIAPPVAGVVVNVNDSHIVQLGSVANIAAAKSELVRALPAGGAAVLNFDDPWVRTFAEVTKARTIAVGTGPECEVRAAGVALDRSHTSFVLCVGEERAQVEFRVPSRRAVLNALLGAGAGIAAGLELEEIAAGLASFRTLPGRMSPLRGRSGFGIIDNSFLSVPQSTELILAETLAIPSAGRRILAQGEIYGAYQHGEVRAAVYDLMAQFDAVFFTGPLTVAHHRALAERAPALPLHWHETPEATGAAVLALAEEPDVVLVNGHKASKLVVGVLVDPADAGHLVDDAVQAGM